MNKNPIREIPRRVKDSAINTLLTLPIYLANANATEANQEEQTGDVEKAVGVCSILLASLSLTYLATNRFHPFRRNTSRTPYLVAAAGGVAGALYCFRDQIYNMIM